MAERMTDDTLSGLAPLLRVRPMLDDVCRLGGAWTSPHEPEPNGHAYFHIVTQGCALLDRRGNRPVCSSKRVTFCSCRMATPTPCVRS